MSSPGQDFTAVDLVPGQAYVVTNAFEDYDGILHVVGESWRYVDKNFLPYEDGLTLYVDNEGRTVTFRLQWRPEAQAQIIDRFSDYVTPTSD